MPKLFKSDFRLTTLKEAEILAKALKHYHVELIGSCKLCRGSERDELGSDRVGCQSHAHELGVLRAMIGRL